MEPAISDLALAKPMTDVDPSQSRQVCGGINIPPFNFSWTEITTTTEQSFQNVIGNNSQGIQNNGEGDIIFNPS